MKRFLYISLVFFAIITTACTGSGTSSSTVNRSLAQLSGFYFLKNDSFPGLSSAVFSIEERNDTGLVWNKDSILYGTSLKRVSPRFTFASTPYAAYLTMQDSVYVLTGYDTLDFTKTPIYLTIRSADKTNTKIYKMNVTVHQADPDLYTWAQLTDEVYIRDDSEQRVVELNNKFIMLCSNGFSLAAYSSADGAAWTNLGSISGLPKGFKVRQVISNGVQLFYGQDSIIYTSSDAVNWTEHKVNHPIHTMLLWWNGEAWALVSNSKGDYELAYSDDGTSLTLSGLQPGDDFPISDFGTVTFRSSSYRERAMIIGGFAENGRALNSRWNLEYSKHIPDNNGYRMQDFSIDHSSFNSLTGISVINYNNQLMLFGGVDGNVTYLGRDILVSKDEGLTWTKADTAKNQLPEAYQARQKISAIVRDNNIYIFGGEDSEITYSDVYKGRLNSIDW